MNILHVYKTYLPDNFDGVARVIYEICEGTKLFGAASQVFSLSPNGGPASVQVGTHLSHRAREDIHLASTSLSFRAFSRFRELAREADLVHYHFPWPLMDLLHFYGNAGRPSIVTYHSDVVRQRLLGRFYAPLMHRFLAAMDRIVATSPAYAQTSPVLPHYADRLGVIPIGIAEMERVEPARAASWRERLGARFLLFVGALRYYKGLTVLVEATRATGLPVVVVGSGEMATKLERNRPASLTLLGELDERDKDAVLSLADGFVFPSHLRSEGFGVALLEAARAGKPMISCEIGTGTSHVNLEGETGFIVPGGDTAALGAAMCRLWENPAMAAAMGARARARYLALFTAEAMAKAYFDLYETVLAEQAQLAGLGHTHV
ncbi:glycosyltransferase [Bradyrhizobium sp. Leo170]|uniref:glycosyltransferase n=1 Tax=Bradyrhizobium sp. Leo170 TaxID=1571199 RepID=UPI00102E390F|nr:glycosyltransferase [Bradyrhizobium sp. Leo170]TAI66417.1 glycosyl transferase family 1 [Bradyrhizobium sp. Leo170]